VITRSERWPGRGLDGRRGAAAAALGVALFLASWALLHVTPLSERQLIDTPTYQRYGDAVLDGQMPYRDFGLEYPPGALPAFILPSLAPEEHYRSAFETLMVVFGLGMVVLVAATLAAGGASNERVLGGTALAGLSPLLLGTVVQTRYDLWPALLTIGALAALLAGRDRLGFGVLGLAVAAKIYPGVLVPIALVYVARRSGARAALIGLGVFLGVLLAVSLPFLVTAPGALVAGLAGQAGRPLQIESAGSSVLLVADQLGAYEPTVVSSHGSQNLTGGTADVLAGLQTALQIVGVLGIWVLFATRRGWDEELVAASAAAVAAFAVLGKVLSPQFLVWLVPLVPLVAGRIGLLASATFVTALVLTHAYFPQRYWNLVAAESGPVWLLAARNAVFLALAAVLAAAIRPERGRSRSA
jgi:hypothetical protein